MTGPLPALEGIDIYHRYVLTGPGDRGWVYTVAVPDTGGVEAFHRSPAGEERRLTFAPGDDSPTSWSPDGRAIVFGTSRWDPNFWHRLAILDLETGEIRQLTTGGHHDTYGVWSPDGTRIAFLRKFIARTREEAGTAPLGQICWITVDGALERCFDPPLTPGSVLAWRGSRQVIALFEDGRGGQSLNRFDLETLELHEIDSGVLGASVSPDGRWVLALRTLRGARTEAWHLYPVDRPDRAVPVLGSEGLDGHHLLWGPWTEPRYLDRLEIVAANPVPAEVPMRLRARGLGAEGRPVAPSVLRWDVDDPSSASIDAATGVLLAHTAGDVTVRVSAGGWREATLRLAIAEPRAEIVLLDDWEGGLRAAWVPFGEPTPELTGWPGGGLAFWNRGDGYYGSGVYSRGEFPARTGLGVEVQASTPITGPRAQKLSVSLTPWTKPEAVAAWDHRTGALPAGAGRCSFSYPLSDGFDYVDRSRAANETVPVSPSLSSDTTYSIRLQIFPDGTCGLAIDGRALARSQSVVPLDVPYRAVLSGNSLGTKILVGDVRMWTGTRADIDWTEASILRAEEPHAGGSGRLRSR